MIVNLVFTSSQERASEKTSIHAVVVFFLFFSLSVYLKPSSKRSMRAATVMQEVRVHD